jgi:RNA polymerase sigma-70 factor (ECF subfamily)
MTDHAAHPPPESTCWTLIRGAAAGLAADRDAFARRYAPVVHAYLAARWRRSPLLSDLDDAAQDVFLACFRAGGALGRADPGRGGFQPFLYGVVRNVALRYEAGRARRREHPPAGALEVAAREEELSRVFDRAWAKEVMRQAAERQAERAGERGETAVRRVELLRLRFHEGLSIREIARRWQADPARLHHEYAQARQEFRAALLEVVAFHQPGSAEAVEREAADLLRQLVEPS